jgi:hypothetical protein
MTDLLKPPPEHDLPSDRAAEMRRAVMRSAAGTGRRRLRRGAWILVPALSVLAVLVALAGLRPGHTPSAVGSPSPAPSVTSSPGATPDDPVDTDAGPLSETDAAALVDQERGRLSSTGDGELGRVLVARRTTTDLGRGTFVVWIDTLGSTWWAARIPGVMGRSGPVSGPAARTTRLPDADHPVVRMTDLTFGWSEDEDRPGATARDLASGNFYLVSGSVGRVEVRMTVEGEPGAWFTAPVHDGYVYIPAVAPGPHSTSEHVDEVTTVEDRAFDHDGAPVRITGR